MNTCAFCLHIIRFDYSAVNECWNKVIGYPENPRGEGYFYCIDCFVFLCEKEKVTPEFVRFYGETSLLLNSQLEDSSSSNFLTLLISSSL